MQVKDWSQTIITYSTTINPCEEGVPMACRPLEILAKMQVQDWSQTIITYSATINLCEEGVPMACRPLELLADMQVKDWSQTIITYSTTINLCEEGVTGMQAPGASGRHAGQGLELRRHHLTWPP